VKNVGRFACPRVPTQGVSSLNSICSFFAKGFTFVFNFEEQPEGITWNFICMLKEKREKEIGVS